MSIHLGAGKGDIADTVMITGDPIRAKFYAEEMLSNSFCYNRIRAAFGYTGTHKGKQISIQGTGIGIPSTALYIHELVHFYGVQTIIRVGTCGAIQPGISIGEVVVAESALTDSNAAYLVFGDKTLIPKATLSLLQHAKETADRLRISTRSGAVFSTDLFYCTEYPLRWRKFIEQGVLAVDMETSILYALAEKYLIQALSILTVSDNIMTGEKTSPENRERNVSEMMKLALEVVVNP